MNNTREKGRAVFLAALMLLSVIAMTSAFAGGATAQTTTVSGGGDELQTAIDEADQGDVIEVTDDSTYNQIIIDRSSDANGLTIRAADNASPTISHDATSGEPTVAIDQNGITLEGFTIKRTNSDNVAQAVRVAGDNIDLIDNTYELDESPNDAAVGVLTDSSGAAGNPPFSGPINDVEISGGEIITNDASQTGVLVADNGDASFGSDGSVSVSGVTFTANADSTHVLELDTGGGVVDTAAALNENTFDTAASPDSTTGEVDPGSFARDGLITSTIQGAINGAASEATIKVAPGSYETEGSVATIDTSGISLESTGGSQPTLKTTTDPNANGEPTVDIRADGVTVDGFNIKRVVSGSGNPTQGVKIGGFEASGGSNTKVLNNDIELTDQSGKDDHLAYGVGVLDAEYGSDVTGVEISGNTISGFDGTDEDAGIGVFGFYGNDANAIIEKNTIEDNQVGISVVDSNGGADATIQRNNIIDNAQSGIFADTDSGSIDATSNWWGDDSGPSGQGPGSGASVSENVDFRPWLDAEDGDPIDTTETTISSGEAEIANPTVTRGTSISFDDSTGDGNTLTITERSRPSDSDETAVTTAVEENPGTTASESLAAIEVTNAPDTSATIQITLDAADVTNPSSVGIVRVPDGGDAQILPTDVASTNEEAGTITFEADTPGFSTFVAAELTSAEVSFDRSNLAVTPEEVDVGEKATISLDLTNTGDRSAAAGVAVSVDGERAVSQVRGPVAPGETQTVSLNVSLSQPGERTISVAGVDETATVTVAGDAVDPSVTIEDQQATGQAESVTVASATAPEAYVIAVHETDDPDDDALSFDIRGVSEPFDAGESATDVTIELDEPITQSQTVTAMLHAVDEDVENNLGAPLTVDGEPVTDAATLTVNTEGAGLERFDQAGTGTITFDDVLAAIEANNTDEEIGGEPVTFEDVLAVIEANNEGTTFEV